MANIFDKFLDSMKLYDDAEDEEEELTEEAPAEEEEYEEEPEPEPAKTRKSFFSRRQPREEEREEEEEAEEPAVVERPRPARNYARTAPMRTAPARAGMEVNMIRPTSMDDARDICDMLLSGRAVVINLEGVQVDLAQRIIDFSSGSCYSIDGNLQKISSYIFIITPSNIELTGEFQSMTGGNAVR